MIWRKVFWAILIASLAGGVFVACGDDASPAPTLAPATTPAAPASPSAMPTSGSTAAGSPTSAASAAASASAPAAPAAASASTPAATAAPQTQPPLQPTATAALPTASPSGPQSASVGVVEDKTFLFSPASVAVAVGGTVTWAWSNTTQFHNVALANPDGSPLATSGDVARSGSFSFTFTKPGTYNFVCETHEFSIPPMKGSVTVQ
jgi:plastocyanin